MPTTGTATRDPEGKSVLRIGVYGWRAECVRVGVKTRGVLRREPSERMRACRSHDNETGVRVTVLSFFCFQSVSP